MMEQPPPKLDNATVLYYVLLNSEYKKTDKCRHFVNGLLLKRIAALAICLYQSEKEVYLFHCDTSWKVITDDLFDSIDDAFEQSSMMYFEDGMLKWIKVE